MDEVGAAVADEVDPIPCSEAAAFLGSNIGRPFDEFLPNKLVGAVLLF